MLHSRRHQSSSPAAAGDKQGLANGGAGQPGFEMIRHRLFSWLSSSAARQSQQPTASTSVQEPSATAALAFGFGGTDNSTGVPPAQPPMIRPIVLSGPSGGGKSTILAKAMKEYADTFAFSVSHTTRKPRGGELEGEHYHFVDRAQMERMISAGEFFEHAEFGGNIYGTSKKAVAEVCGSGKICVLDVELQGVHNFKAARFDAKFILIRPPSLDVLESRLRQRGTETEESIAKRLKHAREDLEAVEREPALFDCVVVNEQLDKAYADFLDAIRDQLDAFQQFQKVKAGQKQAGEGAKPVTEVNGISAK